METRGVANLGRGALRLRSVAVCLSAVAWGDCIVGKRTKKMRDFSESYVDNGGRLCIWLGDNDDGEL